MEEAQVSGGCVCGGIVGLGEGSQEGFPGHRHSLGVVPQLGGHEASPCATVLAQLYSLGSLMSGGI